MTSTSLVLDKINSLVSAGHSVKFTLENNHKVLIMKKNKVIYSEVVENHTDEQLLKSLYFMENRLKQLNNE